MKRLSLALALIFVWTTIVYAATGTVTVTGPSKHKVGFTGNPVYKVVWTFTQAGGIAEDTTKTAVITGKVVGCKFVETSITAACTIKILDAAGRDVLQGLFVDTEASDTATADNHYRVPVDDTSGGYIYLVGETVSFNLTSGNGTETGSFELYFVNP